MDGDLHFVLLITKAQQANVKVGQGVCTGEKKVYLVTNIELFYKVKNKQNRTIYI